MEAAADVTEAVEVSSIAGVVDRVLSGLENEAAVTPMHVANDAGTPVPRGRVGDLQSAELRGLPPIHLNHAIHAKIGDEIADVARDDNGGFLAVFAKVGASHGAERRTMEMIEMSMRDKNEIDARKVGNAHAGSTEAFQHKNPGRVIGIDYDILAAELDEEAGVADEGDAELVRFRGDRLVSGARAGGHSRVAYQSAKLFCFLAESNLPHER